MIIAELPTNEAARIEALHSLHILDTPPEERFDRLTRLARRLFDVPIAVVTLADVNRMWFKSSMGLDYRESPRDVSFCSHAILSDDITVIGDAALDERFSSNPQVTGAPYVRFYAGCPIKGESGFNLGTLCVLDMKPRAFGAEDRALLKDLAAMVEQELSAVRLATIDDLTKLSNRRGFEALAQHALGLCKRVSRPASLLYFDLDKFKQINDRFGHAEGDTALINFASLLAGNFRESDVIGRLGGDEFAVFLTNTALAGTQPVLGHFENAVQKFNQHGQRQYGLHYSVGAVEFDPAAHQTIGDLMQSADALMYERKRQSRAAAG
jgi:diguanylate cyclase (GGDEF)-like protein